MLITTGRVSGGSIEVDVGNLPEGAKVTILAPENGEIFEVSPDDEAKLLAAIAEAERGEVVNASEVLEEIRKS
jgi:hypothetical protein